jgi:hypothetical protein
LTSAANTAAMPNVATETKITRVRIVAFIAFLLKKAVQPSGIRSVSLCQHGDAISQTRLQADITTTIGAIVAARTVGGVVGYGYSTH